MLYCFRCKTEQQNQSTWLIESTLLFFNVSVNIEWWNATTLTLNNNQSIYHTEHTTVSPFYDVAHNWENKPYVYSRGHIGVDGFLLKILTNRNINVYNEG